MGKFKSRFSTKLGSGLGSSLSSGSGDNAAPFTPIVGFANGGFINGEAIFTRASTAYAYVGGVLTSFATNVPRFGSLDNTSYTGLVMEGAGTNLLLQSDDLNTTWTKTSVTITTNTTTAPDGTITADTLARTSALPNYLGQDITKAASAIQYTFSAFVHRTAGTGDYVPFRCQGGFPARVDMCYRKSTNAIVSSAATTFTGLTTGVQTIDSNWSRVWMTFTTDAVAALGTYASCLTADGQIDSTDLSTSASCVLWRMQLEAGSFMTSPIPTTIAAVTRAADACSIASLNTKPWFNALEGVIVVDFKRGSTVDIFTVASSIDDGTANNRLELYQNDSASSRTISYVNVSGGSTTASADISSGNANIQAKVAIAYKINDFAISLNGATPVTDSSGAVVISPTTFNIGLQYSGNNQLNGVIKSITYYPTRLPNATLQAITT